MDRLHPVSHVKFAEQVVDVRLHRMRAHVERAGNVIIAVAADEKFESIDLLPGQESRLSGEKTLVCAGLLPVSIQHFSREPALALENRKDALFLGLRFQQLLIYQILEGLAFHFVFRVPKVETLVLERTAANHRRRWAAPRPRPGVPSVWLGR